MSQSNPAHHEMLKVTVLVGRYFDHRLQKQPLQVLNVLVHDLRILLHQMILDHFLPLPLEQAREFRSALVDRLMGVYGQYQPKYNRVEDKEHCHYLIKQIILSFELAEQIMEEIPHDPITQRILAVDIPILRPFDYGIGVASKVVQDFPKKTR